MRIQRDVPAEDLTSHLIRMHINSVAGQVELGDGEQAASLHLLAHVRGWFRHGTGPHIHRDPSTPGRL